MNSEMSIPNAGQCGGVFQREQTVFLAMTYHFGEKAKDWRGCQDFSHSPNAPPSKYGEYFTFIKKTIDEAKH